MNYPASIPHPVILFDGVCNFCNASINFLIRQDRKDLFRFAPLQSEAGRHLLAQYGLSKIDLESFVLIENGKAYRKSSAALRVMNKLAWYWKGLQLFRIIPRFIRDLIYDLIARNRYKWFGRKDECMIPTPELKQKFLI